MKRVALLGAGYIAGKHVAALKALPSIHIQAVCDLNPSAASQLAKEAGGCAIYANFDEMVSQEPLDCIHILLPPDKHFLFGKKALEAGKGIFLEKPMALTHQECRELLCLSETRLPLGVNHNYLFFSCYTQLKELIAKGALGPLDHVTITWQKELPLLQKGNGSWISQDPRNICFETGPHLFACLLDLNYGAVEWKFAEPSDPIELTTGETHYRRWIAVGYQGKTCIEVRLSSAPGFEEHAIEVRGKGGFARVDFERDALIFKQHTDYNRPIDMFLMSQEEAKQLSRSSRKTLAQYIKSKVSSNPVSDPFAKSIGDSIRHFYEGPDFRVSGIFGLQVIEACERMAETFPLQSKKERIVPKIQSAEIVVIGGNGFIGKALCRKLLEQGKPIKVITRQESLVQGVLEGALKEAKTVYHLARTESKTWEGYQQQQIHYTQRIAAGCRKAGVERLIYTSTIDLYYAGSPEIVINEETPIDPQIASRNYYAQAKAQEEQLLQKSGLPLVIVRPGIVLGLGSSPFHWGVGMWSHDSICRLWGSGQNPLPFVWVEDVADALVQCGKVAGIEGQSFNLVDRPLLSGSGYVEALQKCVQMTLRAYPTPIWQFYANDCIKWGAKWCLRYLDRKPPSYRDWQSRTQLATYDCSRAIERLGWSPLSNLDRLVEEGISKPAKRWFA